MTVCIAAILRGIPDQIVTVSDVELVFDGTRANTIFKTEQVARRWHTLYSGSPVTPALPIIRRVQNSIGEWATADLSLDDVRAYFTAAYHEELIAHAANTVLATYGVGVHEFRSAEWRERLGDREYERKNQEIDAVKLDVSFLVYGFDTKSIPHLFTVHNPGESEEVFRDFAAIGGGMYAAEEWIANTASQHGREHFIYRLCEAKFLAEKAGNISEDTLVGILRPDKGELFADTAASKAVRDAWKEARYPVPSNAMTALRSCLNDVVWTKIGQSGLQSQYTFADHDEERARSAERAKRREGQ